jgi:hypothetical protein
MTLLPSSTPHRAALVAVVAGALVAGAAGTAPAVGAPTRDPRPGVLADFAQRTQDGTAAESSTRSAGQDPEALRASKQPQDAPGSGATSAKTAAPAPASASSAIDCSSLYVTQTLDHSHLTWDAVAGATAITVKRERFGGAVTQLGSTLAGSTTSFDDLVHNPMGSVAYHVAAVVDGSTTSCRSPEEGYWSMSSDNGVGYPDVFFAGTDKVYEQDTYGPAAPAWSTAASRPAFSPTGRLVAAVEQVSGAWSITVRKASNGAVQWSVPAPAGTMLDEPAFSPDGQRIVAEALNLADLTQSTGLYTVPVNTATHPLTLVPGSTGLATADWVDTPGVLASTTIVGADLTSPTGLLTLVNAATGARTPLPGTEGAWDPMGQADGSILFTTMSSTEATLYVRAADGTLRRIQTWADSMVRWPVTDPDTGNVLVYLVEPDLSTPDVTDDTTWSVSTVDPFTGLNEATGIGLPRDGAGLGFNGFDLRTPVSSGTSNFGGAGHGDILARSTTGVLYAYPLSASPDKFFDARRQLGTGWSTVKQFIAAGDLNSDRRADIVTVDSAGVLWLYPGKGSFSLGPRTKLGSGWSSYAIFSTGDFNGDTRADLIARDSSGNLWLYPGNGRGGLSPRTQIGKGWNIFNAIIGTGDWNYDGKADLIARERTTGYLYLYPGRGNGQFLARKYLGKGWNAFSGFAAPEFYAGLTPLFVRNSTGQLLDYDSVGDGVMNGHNVWPAGSGWNGYTFTG